MDRSAPARADRLGTWHLLLGMLVLVARLLGPTAPVAQAADLALAGSLVICHAGDVSTSEKPVPAQPSSHAHDCLLCPACHLAGQAVLPTEPTVFVWTPTASPADRHVAPPSSTGPPNPARLAAQPTGPPAAIV